jgi:hypothetical protein|eukprot:COSAG01_NODE_2511_length_7543_cov_331.649785_8_plen_80_part_00
MNIFRYDDYSLEQSLKQVHILKRVMFNKKEVKYGRGKKAFVKFEYVYNQEGDEEIRNKILNSIKHYETKLETISKKNNK